MELQGEYLGLNIIVSIARYLSNDSIYYNPEQPRLRCNDHINNLVVQAFLFGHKEDNCEGFDNTNISDK